MKVLVVGKSGAGKTAFAGTFPKPYFFDYDDGLLTLMGKEGIEYDTYKDDDLRKPTAANQTEKKISELQRECPYETVIVDSLTTLADVGMNKVLAVNGRAGAVPQLQDWLQQMNWLKNQILLLKSLPVHVIFIAHVNVEKDENTGRLEALPLVTGKLGGRIGAFFDEVYYIEAVMKGKDIEHRLLTQNNGIYLAKSRLGCLDQYEEPTFDNIYSKVRSKFE